MFLTKWKLATVAVLCACLIGGTFTSVGIARDAKPKTAAGRLLDLDGNGFPDILVTGQLPLVNPKGNSQPKSKVRTVDLGRILDLLDGDIGLDGDAYPDILLVGGDTHLLLTNYRSLLRGGNPAKAPKAVKPKDKSQTKPTSEPLYELDIQILIDGTEKRKLSMTLPTNVSAKFRITEVLPGVASDLPAGNANKRGDLGIFFQTTIVGENVKGVLTELALDEVRLVDGKAVIRRLYGDKHLGKVQGFSFDSNMIQGQLTINVKVQRLGDQERLKVREKAVAFAKDLEGRTLDLFRKRMIDRTAVMLATSKRLEAEIALERARNGISNRPVPRSEGSIQPLKVIPSDAKKAEIEPLTGKKEADKKTKPDTPPSFENEKPLPMGGGSDIQPKREAVEPRTTSSYPNGSDTQPKKEAPEKKKSEPSPIEFERERSSWTTKQACVITDK